MLVLLALLLSTNTAPPQYCVEVGIELDRAVDAQILSKREADRIYERCVTYAYPETGETIRQS